MRLDYHLLLTEISKRQGLGISPNEMPVIVHTDTHTYTMAYLFYEDEDYLIISVPDEDGHEFTKILNKDTILTVEVIYQQMLTPKKDKNPKGDVTYA